MISALTLTAFTAATVLPAATDAPVRLITKHGVELRADEDVFMLFAALNALGYGEETRRKGPPLRAPVFHEIRIDVRDALRDVHKKGGTAGIRKMFENNPAEIETYLQAILAGDKPKLPRAAQKLKGALAPLDQFRKEAELAALFDKIAEEQRNHGATLKKNVEQDFAEAQGLLGAKELRAPLSLVVVPNPLDGHDVVRRLRVGDTRYLIVGPGFETARRNVLEAGLRPIIAGYVKQAWSDARRYKKHWDSLKTSRRITRRFANGEAYLTEALTRAVAYRVRVGKRTRDTDEDFIDEQAKDGIRWARAALKLLDDAGRGSFAEQLPKLIAKSSP